MRDKSLTFASIAAAGLASLCCIGPIAAVALGIGSFGAASVFEGLRPYFLALTALLLAGAFYLNYRRRPEEACEDGACGVSPEEKRKRTMMLWLATIAVALIATFPHYSGLFWGETGQGGTTALAASRSAESFSEAIFDVEGMTCAGCAATLEGALREAPGVSTATVSLQAKTAVVSFDSSTTSTEELASLMTDYGFTGKVRKTAAGRDIDQRFAIEGMTCSSCALGIQATMSRREGVRDVEVSFEDKSARVRFDPAEVSADDLVASFKELGYEATPASGS